METVFSAAEERVLKTLGRKRSTIAQLCNTIYSDKSIPPTMYPQETIAGVVRRINKKCEFHNLKWFLNSYGGGRGGKIVWKDKR